MYSIYTQQPDFPLNNLLWSNTAVWGMTLILHIFKYRYIQILDLKTYSSILQSWARDNPAATMWRCFQAKILLNIAWCLYSLGLYSNSFRRKGLNIFRVVLMLSRCRCREACLVPSSGMFTYHPNTGNGKYCRAHSFNYWGAVICGQIYQTLTKLSHWALQSSPFDLLEREKMCYEENQTNSL